MTKMKPHLKTILFLIPLLFAQTAYGAGLIKAAKVGDTAKVEQLLKQGARVNAKNRFGETALMKAAWWGHTETVKALIEAGADVHVKRGSDGSTALTFAAWKGRTETVKALLEAVADVNVKKNDRSTALMLAAYDGSIETVKVLIDAGADVSAKAKDGDTALIWAASQGHTDVVELLKQTQLTVPLLEAAKGGVLFSGPVKYRSGHPEMEERLKVKMTITREKILFGASEGSSEFEIDPAKVTRVTANRRWAGKKIAKAMLVAPFIMGLNFLFEHTIGNRIDVVVIEYLDEKGQTGAIEFSYKYNLGCPVRGAMMHEACKPPDYRSIDFQSAIKDATGLGVQRKHKGKKKVLSTRESTPKKEAEEDRSEKDTIGELEAPLVEKEGKEEEQESEEEPPATLMFAAREGHTETVKPINSKLLSAAKADDTAEVEHLLNQGADVNAKDKGGWTALMKAVRYGHAETANSLIDAGADVDAKTEKGTTALMFAAEGGHIETVKVLMEAGADVNAETKKGVTASMYAESKGHTEIVEILKQAGARE